MPMLVFAPRFEVRDTITCAQRAALEDASAELARAARYADSIVEARAYARASRDLIAAFGQAIPKERVARQREHTRQYFAEHGIQARVV